MTKLDIARVHQDSPLAHALALMRRLQSTLKTSRKDMQQAIHIMRAMRQNTDYELLNHLQPKITFCVDWDALMATNKNKPDFNLIDYRLSDEELDGYEKALLKDKPTLNSVLASLAEKDYKVSFSFVENSEAWCVSVTGKPDAKFNASSTLTTWSDDPLDGLAMAAYKVFVVFGGGVWKTKTQSRRG